MLAGKTPFAVIHQLKEIIAEQGSLRNIIFSFAQTAITMTCLFLSYRILIQTSGLEALGMWSLLLAFGGFVRLFDVSGASALGRFVPRAKHSSDGGNQVEVIHTLLVSSCILNFGVVLIFFGMALAFVVPSIDDAQRSDARAILPWIMLTLFLMPLSAGVSAAIDGLQRADLRSVIVAIASVISLVINFVLVPFWGTTGFAIGHVAQMGIIIILGWIVLRRHVEGFGWVPSNWRPEVFRRTLMYSLKINGIGLVAVFFEPLCRVLIGFSAGTSSLAVYELASRVIVQIRALVLAGAAPLLPLLASMSGSNDPKFEEVLLRTSRAILWLSPTVALLSVLAAPAVSFVVLERIDSSLIQMNAILSWGWSISLSVVPLYLAAQSTGNLQWNFLSHLALAVSVVLFWMLLPHSFGEIKVVVGIALGLLASALCVLFGNTRSLGQSRTVRSLSLGYISAGMTITIICVAAYLSSSVLGS